MRINIFKGKRIKMFIDKKIYYETYRHARTFRRY